MIDLYLKAVNSKHGSFEIENIQKLLCSNPQYQNKNLKKSFFWNTYWSIHDLLNIYRQLLHFSTTKFNIVTRYLVFQKGKFVKTDIITFLFQFLLVRKDNLRLSPAGHKALQIFYSKFICSVNRAIKIKLYFLYRFISFYHQQQLLSASSGIQLSFSLEGIHSSDDQYFID